MSSSRVVYEHGQGVRNGLSSSSLSIIHEESAFFVRFLNKPLTSSLEPESLLVRDFRLKLRRPKNVNCRASAGALRFSSQVKNPRWIFVYTLVLFRNLNFYDPSMLDIESRISNNHRCAFRRSQKVFARRSCRVRTLHRQNFSTGPSRTTEAPTNLAWAAKKIKRWVRKVEEKAQTF